MSWEETVDDVARTLEAAAAEAPPSRRANEIRASVLGELELRRRPAFALPALAAAALVLAVLVGIGAPAVGSYLDGLIGDPESERAPIAPEPDGAEGGKGLGSTGVKAPAEVVASTPAEPAPTDGAAATSPASPAETPVVEATPSVSPTPTPGPTDSPITVPLPPIPIPTPPLLPGW